MHATELIQKLETIKPITHQYLFIRHHFDTLFDQRQEWLSNTHKRDHALGLHAFLEITYDQAKEKLRDHWMNDRLNVQRMEHAGDIQRNPFFVLHMFEEPALADWWSSVLNTFNLRQHECLEHSATVEDYRDLFERYKTWISTSNQAESSPIWTLLSKANSTWYRSHLQYCKDQIYDAWHLMHTDMQYKIAKNIDAGDLSFKTLWWLNDIQKIDLLANIESQHLQTHRISNDALIKLQQWWLTTYENKIPNALKMGDLASGRALPWIQRYPEKAMQWASQWTIDDLDLLFFEERNNIWPTFKLPETYEAMSCLSEGLKRNSHAFSLLLYRIFEQCDNDNLDPNYPWKDHEDITICFPALAKELENMRTFDEGLTRIALFFNKPATLVHALHATRSIWYDHSNVDTLSNQLDYIESIMRSYKNHDVSTLERFEIQS